MANFFSPKSQALFDDILWLPQEGATTGSTGRPPNSYAILFNEGAILVDAAYSWAMPGVRATADAGLPPVALVLTHADVAGQGDGFEEFRTTYDCPILLHPADAALPRSNKAGVAFMDPRKSEVLKRAGLDVIEMPFHTPGSIMLHTNRNRGVLFAGDSAVGPGPKQAPDPARLERPRVDTEELDAAFREQWTVLKAQRLISSILPLHGTPYVDRKDSEDFSGPLRSGPPMDPASAPDLDPGEDHPESGDLVASGVARR